LQDLGESIRERLDVSNLREPLAVRSSAADEDGGSDAFAGLYDTVLGVASADVAEAVAAVWRSGNTERVRAYREVRGVARSDDQVSVIVQEMVRATASGVAFSRHPGNPQLVLVEAVKGVGEELVSGSAIPDAFSISRATLSVVSATRGRQYLETRYDGSKARLSARDVSAPKLSHESACRVAQLALTLESTFPEAIEGVDVEWAFEQADLKVLQCRSITTSARPSSAKDQESGCHS
jgi:pyruvate,water dikinase